MEYRIWYSTESFAKYIIDSTNLKSRSHTTKKMYESDANNPTNFHTIPDHIKKILYLDAPDLIVELNSEPIFSIEISSEAGTGHNAFQRFARLAASVENNVPAFYIYPEAAIITRNESKPVWDRINPLVFQALDDVMSIYQIPALLYYFPSDYREYASEPNNSPNLANKGLKMNNDIDYAGCPTVDDEMNRMFQTINEIVESVEKDGVNTSRTKLLSKRTIIDRKNLMKHEYESKNGNKSMSPLSATTIIPTEYLLNYLSNRETSDYQIGELLRSRKETLIYKIDAKFRGDPYPGALAAIDYLMCREGKSFEERRYNLVLAWGDLNIDKNNKNFTLESTKSDINDFVNAVKSSESKNLLTKNYSELSSINIPRYYMQVRYGSTFSKVKHIRVFSYFADAILFPNGALWRDG